MKYAFLLYPHQNVRYRQSLLTLAREELTMTLAAQFLRVRVLATPETSCQGLFNQIHEKVTNKRLFIAWMSLLFPAHGI